MYNNIVTGLNIQRILYDELYGQNGSEKFSLTEPPKGDGKLCNGLKIRLQIDIANANLTRNHVIDLIKC